MQNLAQAWKEDLVKCVHFLHQKGFAPATSSNYSFRLSGAEQIYISASGKDKGAFTVEDLMQVDLNGKPINDDRKPSAETALHTLIYKNLPDVGCVLHTHTVYNTVLSGIFEPQKYIQLEGYEVLKGLKGIRTHETRLNVPIFPNNQDIPALAETIQMYWNENPDMKGFLLGKHGLYTWGKTIAEAKRHIEVFEFLFECYYKINTFNTIQNIIPNGNFTYS